MLLSIKRLPNIARSQWKWARGMALSILYKFHTSRTQTFLYCKGAYKYYSIIERSRQPIKLLTLLNVVGVMVRNGA
jgi:hypothetical protein